MSLNYVGSFKHDYEGLPAHNLKHLFSMELSRQFDLEYNIVSCLEVLVVINSRWKFKGSRGSIYTL